MEERDWQRLKKEPGEYIASVVLLHLNQACWQIKEKMGGMGKEPWASGGVSWEHIEPLLKEKWQDLTEEKRNEAIRIFHHVSEAVRESLTDWLGSLKIEIENLAKGGEYSGAYLGSYGHKEGPWNILSGTENIMGQAKGIISTVQLAFEGKEDYEGVASTLDVAWDLLEEIWKKIDLAMNMVAGRYPDKKAVNAN